MNNPGNLLLCQAFKKTLLLAMGLFLFQFSANSQQKENGSIKTALLIVDIQDFYFPGDGPVLVNA